MLNQLEHIALKPTRRQKGLRSLQPDFHSLRSQVFDFRLLAMADLSQPWPEPQLFLPALVSPQSVDMAEMG